MIKSTVNLIKNKAYYLEITKMKVIKIITKRIKIHGKSEPIIFSQFISPTTKE